MARVSSVDPLEKFRFQVSWADEGSGTGNLARAGFHDVAMPKRTTNKGTYREGTDPDVSSLFAGLSTMEDLVMSRGLIIEDVNNDFYKWMSLVHKPGALRASYVADEGTSKTGSHLYKKDVDIMVMDREGSVVRAWRLYNSFPVNFVPGSDLNAGEDGEKMLEQVTLAYEDFAELIVTGGTVTANKKATATDIPA